MLIFGHRGAAGYEPENTIRSFKRAEEFGVDMIELDVRESKDGKVIVFHDWSLGRLFGFTRAVSRATLAELQEVSANRLIPTLDEVLASINTDVNIEVKVHGIEQKILTAIKNFPHKVLISSPYPGVLKKVRALDGNVNLGLIIPLRRFHFLPFVMFLTKNLNLYSVHPRNLIVSYPVVKFLRQFVKRIYVWTVNSKSEFKRMQKLGVEGIYTDYPDQFIRK